MGGIKGRLPTSNTFLLVVDNDSVDLAPRAPIVADGIVDIKLAAESVASQQYSASYRNTYPFSCSARIVQCVPIWQSQGKVFLNTVMVCVSYEYRRLKLATHWRRLSTTVRSRDLREIRGSRLLPTVAFSFKAGLDISCQDPGGFAFTVADSVTLPHLSAGLTESRRPESWCHDMHPGHTWETIQSRPDAAEDWINHHHGGGGGDTDAIVLIWIG